MSEYVNAFPEKTLKRLKQARKDLGLTQSEFAEKLGMTTTAYNLIENGKRELAERHIKAICAIFNIDEGWLIAGLGQEFVNEKKIDELVEYAKKLDPLNLEYLANLAQMMFDKQVDEWEPPTN